MPEGSCESGATLWKDFVLLDHVNCTLMHCSRVRIFCIYNETITAHTRHWVL